MADEIATPEGALRLDVNGDGQFTISDLPGGLGHVFFLPGDWLIWGTMRFAAPGARFLELDADDYGGVLSGSLAGVVWFAVFVLALVANRAVRNFDQALTSAVGRGYSEGRRRLRIAAALLGQRLRRAREPDEPAPETVEFARSIGGCRAGVHSAGSRRAR